MNSKGFTLIELLVVITIIGILASVVLVSFPGAQKKAKDARVVSAISQMRTVWTYDYSNNGNWSNFADTATACALSDMKNLCTEVESNGYDKNGDGKGDLTIIADSSHSDNEDGVCIYAPLHEKDGTSWYCASGDGRAGYTKYNPAVGPNGAAGGGDDCSGAPEAQGQNNYRCPTLRSEE